MMLAKCREYGRLDPRRGLLLQRAFRYKLRSFRQLRGRGHTLRALRAAGRVLQHGLALLNVQQVHAHKIVDPLLEFLARHHPHFPSPERTPRAAVPSRKGRSLSSNIERARFSRERTVPTGQSSSCAASP